MSAMAKFVLTKSVEARKLNRNTLIPLSQPKQTLPYGAIIERTREDRDRLVFYYLGEAYESRLFDIQSALKALE